MSEPLVIVGKGMAATRLVEALSRRALGRFAIAVVGAEPRLAYNRVLLSSVLAGEVAEADIELKSADWWRQRGVTTLYGCGVTAIDRAARQVTLADGHVLPYGKLVLATGSVPIRLSVPGADLPGVVTFRDLGDVERMQAAARAGARVVVIGGGLLGLEAAYGLARGGAKVALVHLMDRLMERQLDAEAAGLLADAMRARGIALHLSAQTKAIHGTRHVEAVELADGTALPADLVVFAAGIRPATDLAKATGLSVARGVIVSDTMMTSDQTIFALGECAEHRGQVYGLVEPAYEQAEVLANTLVGKDAAYAGSVMATNLKVSGINVFSAGDFLGGEGTQSIVLRDRGLSTYRKLVLREGRLTGAVLFGDTTDALWYLDLIRKGTSVADMRADLVFGRAIAEPAPLAQAA
jgi:nitrite reductase (NADH) large subunit